MPPHAPRRALQRHQPVYTGRIMIAKIRGHASWLPTRRGSSATRRPTRSSWASSTFPIFGSFASYPFRPSPFFYSRSQYTLLPPKARALFAGPPPGIPIRQEPVK